MSLTPKQKLKKPSHNLSNSINSVNQSKTSNLSARMRIAFINKDDISKQYYRHSIGAHKPAKSEGKPRGNSCKVERINHEHRI